jgi:hypothetical protein
MSKTKIFVRSSSREKTFDNGGQVINSSLNVNDLQPYMDEKGYCPIVIATRNKVDEWDNTHYIYIDEFALDRKKERQQAQAQTHPEEPKAGDERPNPFK